MPVKKRREWGKALNRQKRSATCKIAACAKPLLFLRPAFLCGLTEFKCRLQQCGRESSGKNTSPAVRGEHT